jgi:hypothetical protein
MEQFGAIGGGKDQCSAPNELPGVFERGIAVLESFRDHSIALTRRDPIYLPSELDAFGDAVHGYDTFGAIVQGGGNRGRCTENIDDHYDSVVDIIEVQ